ncbi:MAG: Ger(x)C family spore germination protein [Candidatus Cohnella colombiensis]|uniref:Ger(X)C family spore germination protein n=1 Tax=Candidatus Cohnella colombiensis TaxID=3121368 RepID=A0AA95F2V3_9BACL|nr:MAG: Ger(x)C family spore germination protein [Cohnella sp.]
MRILFKHLLRLQLILMPLLLVSGCWDYKELQKMNYITTLAIDYKDNQYTLYLQSLDFSSIAKQESGKSQSNPKNSFVKATGSSISEAFFKIFKAEQLRIFLGHVISIVLTKEALLQIGPIDLTDLIDRYREVRYNVWLFGSEEKIEDILNINLPYGYPLNDSVLLNPMTTYRQDSYIKPIYMFRFITEFNEAGKTVAMPILSLDKNQWTESGKPLTLLKMTGDYYFHSKKFVGQLTDEQLMGKRFLSHNVYRFLLKINGSTGEKPILFLITEPKFKIDYTVESNTVLYNLKIVVKAHLEEMLENLDDEMMIRKIKDEVEKEILTTFQNGKAIGADVLSLNDHLYRYHHQDWTKYLKDKEGQDATQIRDINVKVIIVDSGKYKARTAD